MNQKEIQNNLLKIISNITQSSYPNYETIRRLSLTNDLQFDSLKFVELIVEIESKFNIEIIDEDIDINKLDNLENINAIITRNIKVKK